MSKTLPKWDETREATLVAAVGSESPVTAATVEAAAVTLETTAKSVAAKLRKMGNEVASMAKVVTKSYTEAEESELQSFLEANPGAFTYAEVAAEVLGGSKSAKQIQGKILSMELTSLVKPTPKVERVKTYTDAEEAKLFKLLTSGKDMFIEDIADTMGKAVNSIRGKILSLTRTEAGAGISIPKQRVYKSKDTVDPIAALGDDVADMTVTEIAEAIDKTERGVKTMLTHRGISCKGHDGAKKAEKIAADKAATA
jgi:hypothetical protein